MSKTSLTADQITRLDAGAETDEAVAIQVMGWTLGPPKMIHGYMMHGMIEVREWIGSTEGTSTHTQESWKPSRSIADAWRVVEHFRAQPARVQSRFADVLLDLVGDDTEYIFALSPVLICKAALLTAIPDTGLPACGHKQKVSGCEACWWSD